MTYVDDAVDDDSDGSGKLVQIIRFRYRNTIAMKCGREVKAVLLRL